MTITPVSSLPSLQGERIHIVEQLVGQIPAASGIPDVSGMPTVLCIGGLGSCWCEWLPLFLAMQSPKLTETTGAAAHSRPLRLVCFDRPGSGLSPMPAQGTPEYATAYTVVSEAERIRDVLDQLGAASPVLVLAHSMGAFYAEGFARAFPERCAGVLFLDPSVPEPGDDDGYLPFPDTMLPVASRLIPGPLFGVLRRLSTPRLSRVAGRVANKTAARHRHSTPEQLAALRLELSRYPECSRFISAQRISEVDPPPWRSVFLAAEPRLPLPWVIKRRTSLALSARQLDARMETVRPAPHHLMMSHPESVAETVRELVQELVP
ncbi:alpha/beta hydrolase [Acaricomes phytoseiuli]|uniref:alpha/beta fold hydrolase n=1 Tax=Acaricomes phytoseiuli TaxID=291968 RepID=UPI000364A98C|nr:alpha/beta hydrolase [Acaricomes phytoseiuli]MCW1248918.1 alpha/beta hydrolase [Acaricomes phytoseiuli]